MRGWGEIYGLLGGLILISLSLFTVSCSNEITQDGRVVFTQIPVDEVSDDQLSKNDFRYTPKMKIAIAELKTPLENIQILTEDFCSARAPEISFEGTMMVFSGQKGAEEPWQIWKLNLSDKSVTQITESRTNCTDPTWLPDGRIAFSKLVTDDKALKYHALFTIGQDGCCEERISFQPHEDLNASVMNDGRILFASKQVFPENGPLKYLAMRPDGTKAELFYLPENEEKSLGKASDNFNGKVLFTESGNLTSVKFSRPLHTNNTLRANDLGLIQSVFSMGNEDVLISIKKPTERSFGLMVVGISKSDSENFYFNNSEYHSIEPIIVIPRSIPKKLPSRVNASVESGYFICMDSENSEIEIDGETFKVQVLGMTKVLGETVVEDDGSFYLELIADRPVRFQTLNDSGEILRGPSSWMWVRPNERRGCVGCHENREIAPGNAVPKAIEKAPFAMIR